MKTGHYITASCAAALLLGASSCKGRTLDNVVPTGDTIEVAVGADAQQTDTTIQYDQQL